MFRDKIVHINSDYLEDAKISVEEKYVVDIYKLASHLIPEDVVKTMKIHEIIKKVNNYSMEKKNIHAQLHNYHEFIFIFVLVSTNRC